MQWLLYAKSKSPPTKQWKRKTISYNSHLWFIRVCEIAMNSHSVSRLQLSICSRYIGNLYNKNKWNCYCSIVSNTHWLIISRDLLFGWCFCSGGAVLEGCRPTYNNEVQIDTLNCTPITRRLAIEMPRENSRVFHWIHLHKIIIEH